MNIIIIANFPSRLDGSKEKGRFLYLGEMLSERGHQVELICSDFNHGKKTHYLDGSININAYRTRITVIHEPGYPNNVHPKRLWSHFVWGRNVYKYLKSIQKPDLIYSAIPSLTANVKAAKYCERLRIRFLIDVQDLWPEAFVLAIKNKILQLVFKPLEWYANQVYQRANIVIAVSETYAKRALKVNNKASKGVCVYLGNDGSLFDEARISGHRCLRNNDELWLCYIGTMGYSYDIPCVLNALNIYKERVVAPRMKFVAIGGGPLLNDFKEKAQELEIDSEFTGPLSYEDMVAKMCSCDIVVNPIVKNAAQSITNKVGDYALSGLPVVSTQENPEYRALVDEYKCGINCRVGDAEDVAKAFMTLAKDEALRKTMGANARKLGLERFDRRVTYKRIVDIIEDNNV